MLFCYFVISFSDAVYFRTAEPYSLFALVLTKQQDLQIKPPNLSSGGCQNGHQFRVYIYIYIYSHPIGTYTIYQD